MPIVFFETYRSSNSLSWVWFAHWREWYVGYCFYLNIWLWS